MTDTTNPQEALRKIGYRISDCAHAALGIDLLSMDRCNNNDNLRLAISGISSVLEEQLKQLADELDDWVIAEGRRQREAVKPPG